MDRRADVVVVGAGTAGCSVAAALAMQGRSVVLVEAGQAKPHPATESVDVFSALSIAELQWPATSVVPAAGRAAEQYVRARTLGGGGAINGMVAMGGAASDFDSWEAHCGCLGWSYADLRSSIGGVLRRTTAQQPAAFDMQLGAALAGVGVGAGDPSAVDGSGWGPVRLSEAGGRRRTGADLLPGYGVELLGGCEVARILLDGGQASGIELADGTVVAAGTVVSCAGAVGSPLLLWRSGISLPSIGAGLQDHPGVRLAVRVAHDAQAAHGPVFRSAARIGSSGTGANDIAVLAMQRLPGVDPDIRVLSIGLLTPHSRGSLSVGPDGAALLEPDLLGDERDRARLRAGVRLAAAAIDAGGWAWADPGHAMVGGASDDELDEWMAATTGGWYHATGTCRMGPAAATSTVVDPSCAVVGHRGLYVVDASVMPSVTSASTDVAVAAVAALAGQRLAAALG